MVGKLVMRERRVWRILTYLSTACEVQSLIVWMVAGMTERKTDCAQGDESLEGAEGNGDNFGVFHCAAHEDGANGVFCM
jgi:hypothetical protein